MKRLCGLFSFVFIISCETTKTESPGTEEIKKNQKVQTARPSLPSKPLIDFEKEDIGCHNFEKIAMLSCLNPEMEIPFPYCELNDAYAVVGILPYAYCTKDPDIIAAHLPYAKKHYRGSTVGLMERSLARLRGQPIKFSRPLIYQKGLSGYKAYQLMSSIHLQYFIAGSFSSPMKAIVQEHSRREPDCLYFQYLNDLMTGKWNRSLALGSEGKSDCGYYKHFQPETIKIDIYYVQHLLREAIQ
jgi:hypothetical protein